MGEYVHLEVDRGVGTIRLDRPPANAIDEQVGRELDEAVREAGAHADVGAIVVWGGPSLFAAGADIKSMASLDPDGVRPVVSALGDALIRLEASAVVTIASVNGFALGGGCEIALACDLRIAASDAMFGQPEVLIGVMPGAGGTVRLPRVVGVARATDLMLSGRRVDAAEALSIGLVSEVVSPTRTYQAAVERARRLAEGPRQAIAAIKGSVAADPEASRRLAAEREAFIGLFATGDQREGMRAFLDKRDPRFQGS
ncbi:MAG: enoyl-CoA hydratase-related protein [Actinomycetota bacterium]